MGWVLNYHVERVYWSSLASQPYFSSCACALGRGAGEAWGHAHEEKYGWLERLVLEIVRVKSSVDDRLQIMSMAQKTPLPNITDFLTSSSRADRECTEERDGSSPPKRNKHRETFDQS